ncbi:MAG TPA: permease-like cell division protein FtsX [Symbiobacteriaceae bacterium]|nr:permease-like cell division protein FtsX [Symbiobacteriaceae bacterium]
MSIRAWVNALRDAIRSITHSTLMSVASTASVAVSLLVLAVMLLLALNLEYMAASVESQVEVRAYICAPYADEPVCKKQEPTAEQKQVLVNQIAALPGVAKATYVSKEQALNELKKLYPEDSAIMEGYEGAENPLFDSVLIQVKDATQIKPVAEAVQPMKGIRKVNWGQDWVDKLTTVTHAVRLTGIGLVLLLVVATVLTISNTIRLAVFARRREIAIMKLVGATDWYIRRPFMLEGIILGLVGSGVALGGVAFGYAKVEAYVRTAVFPIIPAQELMPGLTVSLLLLGTALGAIGSIVSVRKFLKV